jgi:hypothetical protein
MKQTIVVPILGAIAWVGAFSLGYASGVSFLLAFSMANIATAIVFLTASSINLRRVGRR